ncbi:hypothetical protein [Loigolactobacillus coryniformis]|uniref:Lipoprotein n=1 Tax=Loigolactobacillus coryniformis TaxID=1610 RepID=A0A5B8TH78_9LACO|nr:hypothetical protein [Loigolactobacillus coryniformis]QEA53208.1 hypothetical protein FGL77_07790 [Loigolactobacillus coryniformis]
MKKELSFGLIALVMVGLAGCGAKNSSDNAAQNSKTASLTAENASLKRAKSAQSASLKATNSSLKQAQQATKEASNSTSNVTNESENESVHLTDEQKAKVNAAFLAWASQQAEIGEMAVSDWYFDHGSAGHGDWYAQTPDGKVQVQDFGVPGAGQFPIHAVGGCVFYTAKDGTIGRDKLYAGSFADNYAVNMDFTKPVSKYLLGDNGVVYELKTGNGTAVSTNTGFGEYSDDGQTAGTVDQTFMVSKDGAARAELQKLLATYR